MKNEKVARGRIVALRGIVTCIIKSYQISIQKSDIESAAAMTR